MTRLQGPVLLTTGKVMLLRRSAVNLSVRSMRSSPFFCPLKRASRFVRYCSTWRETKGSAKLSHIRSLPTHDKELPSAGPCSTRDLFIRQKKHFSVHVVAEASLIIIQRGLAAHGWCYTGHNETKRNVTKEEEQKYKDLSMHLHGKHWSTLRRRARVKDEWSRQEII